MVYKPANGQRCPDGNAVPGSKRAKAPEVTVVTSKAEAPFLAATPAAPTEAAQSGLSTKQKVIIGAAIGAAITGIVIACVKSDGCGGGGGVSAFPAGQAVGGLGATSNPAGFPTQPELLLFGGRNHQVFLGCLNCSGYDSASVFNKYGEHGSPYATESIFNKYGDYGSRYGDDSACSRYASNPPVIVDRDGNAYGRLTVNRSAYQIRNPLVVAWLTGVCER